MIIRTHMPADTPVLAEIYRDAVEGMGSTAYDPRQVAVWASFASETPGLPELLAKGFALVAVVDDVPAAFCQLYPDDHISLLYTATQYARRGLATAVYRGIEAYAQGRGQRVLTTDASKLSRPFFEREGFVVRRTEQTIRQGVSFERYQMEKVLEAAEGVGGTGCTPKGAP